MARKSLNKMTESEIQEEIEQIKNKPHQVAGDYRRLTKLYDELTLRNQTEIERLKKLKTRLDDIMSEL